MPSVNAQDACVLPSPAALDCYFGATTPDAPESFPPFWCTAIHNNHWFAFTADANTATFEISTYGCAEGNGIQAAVLSTLDCITFAFVSPCIGDIPSGSSATLVATNLVPGDVYYICIDGSGGALCDYSINGVNPTVNGPASGMCLPSAGTSTYTVNTVSTWSINPPTAGSIQGNPVGLSVVVAWQEPGPAQVCAQSLTCPNAPNYCLDVFVGEDITTTEMVDVCQNHTVECAGQTFSTGGTFPVTLPSYLGCDSTINCIVHLIPTVTTTQNVHMCQGGSASCAGEEFFAPGLYPVTLQAWQGCDSVVRCVVTVVPTTVAPTKFVTMCAPGQYNVCSESYSQTGIYATVCTGWLGCDSILNTDLAVLDPNAVIAPPAILDCGANLNITLNGSGSNINNATGGVTLYKWTGPGIIGPDNLPTAQVNQPGQYCLILTHGRQGIYCADTACVTVLQDAGIPQLPQLTGLQNPCAGITLTYSATATGNPPPSSFVWSLPGNHPFTPVPPSSISVTWNAGTPTGQLCVTANNSCGASPAACIPLSVGEQPVAPQVAGPVSVCTDGGDYLFHLSNPQLGTMYNWSIPPGAVLNGSGDTVRINFANAASGQICVVASNGCDTLPPVCNNVQVVPNPNADLSGIPEICNGESLTLLFSLNGSGPFDVVWSDGNQQFTLNDINTGHQVGVTPAQNTNYTLVSVTDNSPAACARTVGDTVTVAVWPLATTNQALAICQGESILLGGALQNTSGVYYDTLNTLHGCDSVIISTLTVNIIDTTIVNLTTCDPAAAGTVTVTLAQANGCDSIVVTNTTLLPSNLTEIFDRSCDPANVGVFTQNLVNQYGCDSTVITTVTFSAADTTYLSATTCDPAGVGVFQQLLTAISDGCDSLIVTTVTLLPSTTIFLDAVTCNPAEVGNLTEVYTNQYGCDSTIITTVSFLGIPPTNLSATTCNAAAAGVFTNNITTADGCDSTIITTVTYVQLPPTNVSATTCDPAAAGVFTQVLTTAGGCDSTVITTVTLLPGSATQLSASSCNPAEVGVFTQVLSNQYGCDSVVTTTVTFSGIPPTNLSATTCDPNAAGVFTNHITTAGGCDSTIITTVSLLPSNVTQLTAQDCDPANVGVFTQDLTNQFGCDSTVITTVSLLPSHQTSISSSSCDPAATGVFTFPLVNQFGCDSIVTLTVSLLPSDSTAIALGTCETNQVGTVVQQLVNQWGCDSTVVTVTSLLPPASCGMTATVSGSTIPCGANTGSLTLLATLGEGPFNYTILSGNTPVGNGSITNVGVPQVVNGLPGGNYTVQYNSSNGFSATAQANIVQLVPPALSVSASSDYGGFDVSCPGASDGAALAVGSGGQSPFLYNWSNGAAGVQANNLSAGTYTVTITDANQCTTTAVVSLTEPLPLQLAFTVNNPKCFGNKNGSITAVATGGVQPYRFALNDGPAQASNVFSNLAAGSYHITAYDANDCESTEIIVVNAPVQLDVELGDDQYIDQGQTATLQAVVNVPFDSLASVVWTPLPDSVECPGCLTQEVFPLVSTSYSVEVVDNNGCRDQDKLLVVVNRRRHIYIPNVFSPGNDSGNDKFSIFARPGTVKEIHSLVLFDRWGEQLFVAEHFQPNKPEIGWDGTFKGEPLNPGVFVWVVQVEFIDGVVEIYKGDVTLSR